MIKGYNTSKQVKEIILKWNQTTNFYNEFLKKYNNNEINNILTEIDYHKELKQLYPQEYESIYINTVDSIKNKSKINEENLTLISESANQFSINTIINNTNNHDVINQTFSNIYTCHEGLLLNYESSLTRQNSLNSKYYNLSAEMLWIGERTNNINEAHVEYFRGITNPVGVKVSSKINIDDFISLIKVLNPDNILGKVLVITRVGNSIKGKDYLEKLIQNIKVNNLNCVFICDPMHGNTEMINNLKTRKLFNLIEEINFTMKILKNNKFFLNGIHLESTPFEVLECVEENDSDINSDKYTTMCDPRLNLKQVLKLLESINNLED
jgi:3-deoxy-7-phosphoheptulonate synthase